ncbi:hypothetical protein T492DRAFT_938214 [Pavlovales sp. CCMP2436]|nr:hypothetical protein T492DRAFT_938214 [Pavlovales sp. CCMP2436]
MKIKKLKRTRKTLLYLQTVHGIRPPYTVLCDGTFIQASIVQRIAIKDELEKVLGAKVIVAVTDAIVSELRKLGEAFEPAAIVAKRLQRISIASTPTRVIADGIIAAVGFGNPMKLFIATEDEKLQARLRKLGAVPLLRLSRGAVVIERASDVAVAAAEQAEPQPKRTLLDGEKQALRLLKRRRLAAPNPLSCKARKRPAQASAGKSGQVQAAAKAEADAEPRAGSRPRKRQRARGKGGAADGAAPTDAS